MKSILLSALIAMTAGAVLAQDDNAPARPPRQPGGPGAPGGGGFNRGGMMPGGNTQLDMLNMMLQNPAALQNTLGLTDAQVTKLRELLAAVDVKIREVDAKIQKLGLEQANVFSATLGKKEEDAQKELLDLTDKIADVSKERARLRIERLLVLNDVLNAEQITKAAELIKKNAARQVEIEKAIAEGDWATVQRLRQEMQQELGLPGGPGGQGRGGQGGGGQQGPGNRGGGNRGGGNRGGVDKRQKYARKLQ